jgi:hypothetical protein
VVNWRFWVQRRVERVDVIGRDHTHNQISVDFTIPPNLLPARQQPPPAIPIMVIGKGPLMGFSLCDEEGRNLSLLTQASNELIDFTILASLAREKLATAPPNIARNGLAGSVERDLGALVRESASQGEARIAERRFGDELDVAQAEWLLRDIETATNPDNFQTVCRLLGSNFIAFAATRMTPDRRLFKISYESYLTPLPLTLPPGFGWARPLLRHLVPTTLLLLLPQAAQCASYHAAIHLPTGVVFRGIKVDPTPDIPRRYYGPSDAYFQPPAGREAVASCKVGLGRHGLVSQSIAMCLAGLAVSVGGVILSRLAHVRPSSGVAASVLVVLPGIFATALTQHMRNPLAAHLASRVRAVVLVSAAISFTEAASLAIQYVGGRSDLDVLKWRDPLWIGAAVWFAVATVSLWTTWRRGGGNLSHDP